MRKNIMMILKRRSNLYYVLQKPFPFSALITFFVKQTKCVYGQMDGAFFVDSYPALESHLQIFSMEGPGK